jgi:tripartite-type tricarboxylate transporter receptor subunit TctC
VQQGEWRQATSRRWEGGLIGKQLLPDHGNNGRYFQPGEADMVSTISRRGFLATTGAAALSAVGNGAGLAQEFPARGVLVIVPYSAGGGSDVSARLLARDLEPILGKPVTVENRVGGGGWIGWGSLATSKPDGYTIGYINAPSMFAGYLDRAQGVARKESLESFTPLINHVVDPNLWAVRPDSKYKSVKDVIDEAKRRPGEITLNGGGHGTDDHVAALGIGANNGTSFQMVHFRGTPEGKTQVLAGNIEVLACNVSEVAEDIKVGQFRILGVMSAERSPFIPNGPTFREQGFDEVWAVSRGVAAPAGLPKDVEATLIRHLEKAITSKEHKAKAEALALDPQIIKGEDYRKFLKDNEQATKKLMGW